LMPRPCTICAHYEVHSINVALVQREPYRALARQYSVSRDALRRHSCEHLPRLLVEACEELEAYEASSILARIERLERETLEQLEAAKDEGDRRVVLSAIREQRGNIELVARIRQLIDERPVTNIVLSPEWVRIRGAMMEALEPYQEARIAVAGRLLELEGTNGSG
jgi:hypothetical protein